MHTFSYKKALGTGILLWAIMLALASALLVFKISIHSPGGLLLGIIGGTAAYFVTALLITPTAKQALRYGLIWASLGICLDILITSHFDRAIFNSWFYWISYGIIAVSPWIEVKTHEPTKEYF